MMPATSDDAAVLRIGKWRVDPALDEISSEGRTVRLEPLAMRLLLCLARHAGHPVELQQLLDEVWTGVIVAQGSVYQAIAHLRRTLGDDTEHPTYIDTVPRKGYRLIAPVIPWVDSGTEPAGPREHETTQRPTLPSTEPAAGAPLQRRTNRRTQLLIAAVVVVASVLLALTWFARTTHAPVALTTNVVPPARSIAVLPFVDLSEKHDQEYFGDGMAEEIINLLAKVPDLKVIGATSSFQFKGKTEDLRRVGATLATAYVVEGSVRKSSDHVRVTAQLIDTRNNVLRWAETYDRSAEDVLSVQGEIATSLVRALQLEVAPSILFQSRSPPRNSEAYDSYLRGLHAKDRYDESGSNEAVAHFRHALELDPSFVPAAEGLAWALEYLAFDDDVPARPGFEQTRAAAESVLKLDPKSAAAHTVLTLVHVLYDWDWPAAEQEAKTAMTLAPNSADALTSAALVKIAVGQWNDAVRLTDAAIAADPLDAEIYRFRIYAFLRLGRLAEAEHANRRMLEISPSSAWGHYFLAMVLLTEGNADAALAEIQREAVPESRELGLVIVYQALHRSKEADSAFARFKLETRGRWPLGFAFAYVALGQKDRAFESLGKAYATKDVNLWAFKGHPWLKSLEQDARYKVLLRKMNLPD